MVDSVINRFGQPIGCPVSGWQPPGRPGATILSGRFCRLEPLDAGRHGESLWAAWQVPDSRLAGDIDGEARWTYLGGRPFHDAAGCHDWLLRQSRRQDPAFMTVVEANSGDALGIASWLNIEPEHGSIELGHLNFSSYLSRTTAATEALFLMMTHAFALGYRRLEWKCDALNAPSRQAAQRLGFQFEGIFRQHRVVRGHNRDSAWYSLLDSEWERLRPLFLRWLAPDNTDALGRQLISLSSLTGTINNRRPSFCPTGEGEPSCTCLRSLPYPIQ
ncbi:GNAT family protein [Halomonas shantousis]